MKIESDRLADKKIAERTIRINILDPMDPSTFLGSVWGMIDGVKYLLRQ